MLVLAHRDGAAEPDHPLLNHLLDVARTARHFAAIARPTEPVFADLAWWAGLLHDLGKYRLEFQEYLRGLRSQGQETQHAVFGAAAAWNRRMKAVAFAINGHHAGLHDLVNLQNRIVAPALSPAIASVGLMDRLRAELASVAETLPESVDEILTKQSGKQGPYLPAREFMVRMLFSCLVDADYLDTERFMQGRERRPLALDPVDLFARLDRHVGGLGADRDGSTLRRVRREIFDACVSNAEEPTGFFSLTTPTGGGKTLAGLAFALRHAERHGLRRVIVVLPFLSIIEQNAKIYRDVLGAEVVVEHHSAIKPAEDDDRDLERGQRSAVELAAENWDAPVIVTTSVQFLESLFARAPSRCRKLHNVARSVVVLDEVQMLPHHLLEPILSVARDLSADFGVSFLFCSATQPGFRKGPGLTLGFEERECREIAPTPGRVFGTLNRVRYELPFRVDGPWDWDRLVADIKRHPQALVVVNLRRHAAELYQRLRHVSGVFHLSSTMCAEHRSETLGTKDNPRPQTIHHALQNDLPCIVVSTQVIEAGVDIDFPVVFRALGPLDAVIQAAGRCNREGRLNSTEDGRPGGLVILFELADARTTPPGLYALATDLTRDLLRRPGFDPARLATDPSLFAEYHQKLVAWKPQAPAIQEDRRNLRFEQVAAKFRVIEEGGQPVVVPYGRAEAILKQIDERHWFSYADLRRLQRFMVNLRDTDFRALGDLVQPIANAENIFRLEPGAYDDNLGIVIGERPPEDFVFFG